MSELDRIDQEDERYFRGLITQVQGTPNPPPKLTAALQLAFESRPELYKEVFDLARQTQLQLIENITQKSLQRDALAAQVESMRRGMDYYQVPELIQGLIENILNSWLRLQLVEAHQAANDLQARRPIADMIFWEQRHSASMRRYLQAAEALARVRKITSQTLQINVSLPGSQQVNFAGDMMNNT